ncbi:MULTISPECIES: MarC family protein [Morganella]|uniref:UPF0056 membrane protein n=2 Tax=Morganella morganii TaxID=582 RepID=A0A9Q4CTJ4_MORMO|nr:MULTISPECIES: MarC family protein [Morganella]BEP23272.1 MarC family protein [Morganella morganii subsp. sibonii]EGT3622923.1 MarC family protein [Morganella morganii]EGT3631064.1 MarC family protein [Morganella morganii]EGT3635351.1 MarC family protein [Morganella morganii]EJD6040442.1 MarC family protein [Morganella morganii]
MNEWLDNILLNYVTFVSLFSPPATITAATIILGRIDRGILWQIAWKIAAGYTLVMLVVIWLGNWLLTALGLSADALTVTGGIALLAQGWPMLIRGVKEEHSDIPVSVTPPKDIMRLAMVPLLFPLSMGGGTIAVGISLAGHSDSLSGLIQLSVVILLMLPTIALTFLATGPLHGRLSPGVMDTLARISGIILVTLAIQLLVSGMVGIITTNLKHIADFAG